MKKIFSSIAILLLAIACTKQEEAKEDKAILPKDTLKKFSSTLIIPKVTTLLDSVLILLKDSLERKDTPYAPILSYPKVVDKDQVICILYPRYLWQGTKDTTIWGGIRILEKTSRRGTEKNLPLFITVSSVTGNGNIYHQSNTAIEAAAWIAGLLKRENIDELKLYDPEIEYGGHVLNMITYLGMDSTPSK